MILNLNSLTNIANSDFVSGIANISQFYNIYQSTKAANYAKMVSELQKQNSHIDDMFNEQTHLILDKLIVEIDKAVKQNETIIKQNNEILNILNDITNKG